MLLWISDFLRNIAVAYRLPKSDMGSWAGCRHNNESVYLAHILAIQNLANSKV